MAFYTHVCPRQLPGGGTLTNKPLFKRLVSTRGYQTILRFSHLVALYQAISLVKGESLLGYIAGRQSTYLTTIPEIALKTLQLPLRCCEYVCIHVVAATKEECLRLIARSGRLHRKLLLSGHHRMEYPVSVSYCTSFF